ncbi:MAG: peptidylprolyl isomerase [Xanthobacteraceae bacterium]|nr:peptidylprolyl isomerase [Xanthobacteraceae bacterium]
MDIRSSSLAFVLAATLAATGALSARAQNQADPVLASVDGVEIRQSDLALAEADIGANLPPITAEARRDALVSYLVDVTILAKAAEVKKLANGPDFANRLAYARKKVLMEALLEQESKNSATEAEKRKLYDESIKKLTPEQEVHARHILVETEDKAKEVLGKLKAGGDFAALAKEVSKDPGASDGGDLGYFSKEQMVPEFAEAAFKLDKGKISDPVKTQFGWHIIKVEDKRQRPVPTYDQVKDQIEAFVARKAQAELVVKLREAAKIERLTPKAETPAQPAPAAGKQKK